MSAVTTDGPRVVLASGERPAVLDRPVRPWRVLGQVAAASVVVLVLVAVLGVEVSRRLAESESVNDAAHDTDLLADVVVQPALEDSLLAGDTAAVARMDTAVRDHVLDEAVLRVKLWTADGEIVYSDEPRLVGQRYTLDPEQAAVLTDPVTQAEVSDLDGPENVYERGEGTLLEVYRPVWTPDGTPLLFETYSRYDVVTDRSGELWRGFAGITLTSLLLLVVLLLPVLWTLLDRVHRAQDQREWLLRHAVEASDEERRRIAATLHDGVVQELAATSFAVAGAAERAAADGNAPLAEQLEGAAGTVRASIRGLRSLLVDIYPASLRASGLDGALADLVGSLGGRGVPVRLELPDGGLDRHPEQVEQLVHRVAQECLRNAVAHAGASQVTVHVTEPGDAVVLEVVDDGAGFDVAAALAEPAEGHFGLRLLTDLATRAGARLEVWSVPGEGTRWRLEAR